MTHRTALLNVSPLDGRYVHLADPLRPLFSEYGLIKHRLHVEVEWLIWLTQAKQVPIKPLGAGHQKWLRHLVADFTSRDAAAIKKLEANTRHDVKALEYWLVAKLRARGLAAYASYAHFGCTSEDITNLAWGLILLAGREILTTRLQQILAMLKALAVQHADLPMMARTHGMPASPTTYGKEMAIFAHRLDRQSQGLARINISGKFNGATGNHNALHLVYPAINWPRELKQFVSGFGLVYNPYTTQIEDHDDLAALLHQLIRINNVLLDLCCDIWGYAALGYFRQTLTKGEVGSSTMPHKVNPIDFENAEGNFGMANALANHCATKLPVSRWQRDLSDSTVLRNLGVVFGHSLVGYEAVILGLQKNQIRAEVLTTELKDAWAILTEAVQTCMRGAGLPDAYTQIKNLTRGQHISHADYVRLVERSGLDAKRKQLLLKLKPTAYTGLAAQLARRVGTS